MVTESTEVSRPIENAAKSEADFYETQLKSELTCLPAAEHGPSICRECFEDEGNAGNTLSLPLRGLQRDLPKTPLTFRRSCLVHPAAAAAAARP